MLQDKRLQTFTGKELFSLNPKVGVRRLRVVGLCMFLVCFFLSANGNTMQAQGKAWELMAEENGVKVFKVTEEVHDTANDFHAEYVLLRLENTNASAVTVTWNHELYYDGTCRTCASSDEYSFEFHLEPGASVEGKAQVGAKNGLRIYSKFLTVKRSELTDFKIKNLTVTY